MASSVVQRVVNDTVREMGLSTLKPKQMEAVLAFLDGKDTFVSLPTGYGKSVIYGILPLVCDKLRGGNTASYSYLTRTYVHSYLEL